MLLFALCGVTLEGGNEKLKKQYCFCILCIILIILTFSDCSKEELPNLTESSQSMLNEMYITKNGDIENAYPEIDLNNISRLPVYKVKSISLDTLYENILDIENAYGINVPFADWNIWNDDSNIELSNSVSAQEYGFDFFDVEQSFSADNNGFCIYFRDILQDKYSKYFDFSKEEKFLSAINEQTNYDDVVEILKNVYKNHIDSYGSVYDNYFYTDYKYSVIEKLEKKCGIILNFRHKTLLSDRDILLDYYGLCDKISFEIQWHDEIPLDSSFSYLYTNVPLYIRKFSMDNFEYLNDYDLITFDDARKRFEKGDNVFYACSQKPSYDEIQLVYVCDTQGYIRPVYMAVKYGIDIMYVMWTDAIK